MTTTDADLAERASRLNLMTEAHEALDIAVAILKRVVPKLEQALGVQHDAARSTRDVLDRGQAALHKVGIARTRTPLP